MLRLSAHALAQRVALLQEILEADGDVRLRERALRTERYFQIEVTAPGQDMPRRAVFEYGEWYRTVGRRSWSMTAYEYEIRFVTEPFGRKAYHWHGGAYHFHCEEAGEVVSHAHFRGYEVNLLDDARPDLLRIFAAGHVDCAGLHPIRS